MSKKQLIVRLREHLAIVHETIVSWTIPENLDTTRAEELSLLIRTDPDADRFIIKGLEKVKTIADKAFVERSIDPYKALEEIEKISAAVYQHALKLYPKDNRKAIRLKGTPQRPFSN